MRPSLSLTKSFDFSASYSAGGHKVIGHNYRLSITTDALSPSREALFAAKVESLLIKKLHSKDLSMHVSFLKGVEISDSSLLKAFQRILGKGLAPLKIYELELRRDNHSKTTLRAATGKP